MVSKARHLIKAPSMSKAPHLVGKKRQKLSDGEKALLMAPKAHLVGKAPLGGQSYYLVSRVLLDPKL